MKIIPIQIQNSNQKITQILKNQIVKVQKIWLQTLKIK